MSSHVAFVHLSTRQQTLVVSFCQQCGEFVAASPSGSNLISAEAAHHCDPKRRKPTVSVVEVVEARRMAARRKRPH